MSEVVLQAHALCVREPLAQARNGMLLDQVDIELHPGELVALVGPNGSGKTTLLRCLSGWRKPDAGCVELMGRPLVHWSNRDRAKQMAWLSQDAPVPLAFSVGELVELGRYAHCRNFSTLTGDDRIAVDRALHYVGLSSREAQDVSTLSGGERQLSQFARLIAQEAKVLLLDEPASALDPAHAHRLFGMLKELRDEGSSILTSVHDLDLAAEYADRMVLLADGKVVANGKPDQVLCEENLSRFYGFKARIGRNEATGSPMVMHQPERLKTSGRKIHVIGGAGSAVNVTRLLYRLGYSLTGGVSHGLDSDARLWEALGIEHVSVPPFSPIKDEAFEKAKTLISNADMVVLCDFPFGPGNARNLELAALAKNLVVLSGGGIGEGRRFWQNGLQERYQEIVHTTFSPKSNKVYEVDWEHFAHDAENGTI